MSSYKLTAHTLHVYAPNRSRSSEEDWKLYRLCEALKGGKEYVDEKSGIHHNPPVYLITPADLAQVPALDGASWLVPIPRSVKTLGDDDRPHENWPGLRICERLEELGAGTVMSGLLRRRVAIRSSSKNPKNRPSVREHIESLEVDQDLLGKLRSGSQRTILLVDDTLTRGTTAMACYRILSEAGVPDAVEAFAVFQSLWDADRTTRRWRIEWEDVPYSDAVRVADG